MQCDCGRYSDKRPCSICQWDKETASSPNKLNFIAVNTVSFAQNKNVSVNRINMIKRRKIHPDGNGEVVLRDHAGKLTNRLASDY